jgi:hypothetical protein
VFPAKDLARVARIHRTFPNVGVAKIWTYKVMSIIRDIKKTGVPGLSIATNIYSLFADK